VKILKKAAVPKNWHFNSENASHRDNTKEAKL